MKPEEIKALRLSRGETQRQFSHTLGMSPAVACLWETGRAKPCGDAVEKMLALRDNPTPKTGFAAAAPDMLAVLENFIAAFETHEVRADFASGMTFGAIIERAKVAIAKAKGERA